MSDYMMSRPGRPLHLSVWAYDREIDGHYPTGRTVPLCNGDRGARWQITGPWAERWDAYRKAGLCRHCVAEFNKLGYAIREAVTGDE